MKDKGGGFLYMWEKRNLGTLRRMKFGQAQAKYEETTHLDRLEYILGGGTLNLLLGVPPEVVWSPPPQSFMIDSYPGFIT